MTRLEWSTGSVFSGVNNAAIYPKGSDAVVWNGIVDITEKTIDSDASTIFFEGAKYTRVSSGIFGLDVLAIGHPDVLVQNLAFDFSYKTYTTDGYILHLVYGAEVIGYEKEYYTQSTDSKIEPVTFEIGTIPRNDVPEVASYSHVMIDSAYCKGSVLDMISDILYGTDTTSPRMIAFSEAISLFDAYASLIIVEHADGTWTATGPSTIVEMTDVSTFKIASPSAHYISNTTYTIGPW